MPKGETGVQDDDRFAVVPDEDIPDEGLLSQFNQEKPTTEEEPDEDETELTEESEDETAETADTETAEPPKVFKVRGRELTAEQIVSEGLLDDLVTQASQVAHFQRLYEEERTKPPAQAVAPVQPQPQADPGQILVSMRNQLQEAVQSGFFEPEFVQFYPQVAAAQLFVYQDYLNLRNVVNQLAARTYQSDAVTSFEKVKSDFGTQCEGLTSKHQVYTKLSDPNEREQFWKFLLEKVNPEVGSINPEFLARQYLAFQQDGILQTVQTKTGVDQKRRNKNKKLATGEGGTPRQGPRTGQPTDDEAVMDAMIKSFSNMA